MQLPAPAISSATDPVSRYRRAEWIADAVVHGVGLAFGLAACIAIALLAIPEAGALRLASLALYGIGKMPVGDQRGDGLAAEDALQPLERAPAR